MINDGGGGGGSLNFGPICKPLDRAAPAFTLSQSKAALRGYTLTCHSHLSCTRTCSGLYVKKNKKQKTLRFIYIYFFGGGGSTGTGRTVQLLVA